MEKEQFVKCMTYLGIAYNKEYSKFEVEQHYEFLKEYSYDELKKAPDDNPTIGIVLCSETDEDIARYSVLKGNEQLFASKYKLYLPTEDELRAEIENQKTIFELQQQLLYNRQD